MKLDFINWDIHNAEVRLRDLEARYTKADPRGQKARALDEAAQELRKDLAHLHRRKASVLAGLGDPDDAHLKKKIPGMDMTVEAFLKMVGEEIREAVEEKYEHRVKRVEQLQTLHYRLGEAIQRRIGARR